MPAPEFGAELGEAVGAGLAVLMGVGLGVGAVPGDGVAEVAADAPAVASSMAATRMPANERPAEAARPELRLSPDAL
jgi:hypothetical protein